MELIEQPAFQEWAHSRGIGLDPRFPRSDSLSFRDSLDTWRFWEPPSIPSDLPHFVNAALEGASPSGTFLLYRRGGGPWFDGSDTPLQNQVLALIAGAVGIPMTFEGALRFRAAERRDIWALVLAYYVCGWGVGEDLYMIPEEAGCFLMTSHHGQLYGHFPSQAAMDAFASAMANAGWAEPNDRPDSSGVGTA